jgi:regulator of replication initiation timing
MNHNEVMDLVKINITEPIMQVFNDYDEKQKKIKEEFKILEGYVHSLMIENRNLKQENKALKENLSRKDTETRAKIIFTRAEIINGIRNGEVVMLTIRDFVDLQIVIGLTESTLRNNIDKIKNVRAGKSKTGKILVNAQSAIDFYNGKS